MWPSGVKHFIMWVAHSTVWGKINLTLPGINCAKNTSVNPVAAYEVHGVTERQNL